VGSLGVVVVSPPVDQYLGFTKGVEDFRVEQLVAKLAVKALVVSVLPRRSWLDVQGLHADLGEPFPNRRGNELRAPLSGMRRMPCRARIVRSDVIWRAMLGEEIGKTGQDIIASQPSLRRQCQALLGELVDYRQDAERSTVMGLALHEVVAPDMARPTWPETDARSVVQPKATAFGLFLGDFQPLALPDPFDPRHTDPPALHGQ